MSTSNTNTSAPAVRFHLSLNVSDIARAVSYFEKVLRTPPAKHRPDYAKFELDSPPLVLSLEARSPSEHGSLNHLGFRYADTATLVDVQRQLESLGIATRREEGVECCYAKQTKFWVHDFDQRLWEFYVLEGDLEHRGAGQALDQMVTLDSTTPAVPAASGAAKASAGPGAVFEHYLGMPVAFPAGRFRQIKLRGTFNVPTAAAEMPHILAEAFQHLEPEGTLEVHVLTAESSLTSPPTLPGPAAAVSHVPVRRELMQAVEEAGFVNLELATFRSGACFTWEGRPLRETRLFARRPADLAGEAVVETKRVLYKGPFRELVDDEGVQWRRGEPVSIPSAQWERLKASPAGTAFVELPEKVTASNCGVAAAVPG